MRRYLRDKKEVAKTCEIDIVRERDLDNESREIEAQLHRDSATNNENKKKAQRIIKSIKDLKSCLDKVSGPAIAPTKPTGKRPPNVETEESEFLSNTAT